ncbi:ArsR/SmtB family transcription factor [Companilactobacillus kedongensis]|uniref:ArsR/SmtB family transcription factor n=1 Tax=Companilactobacillus kedongensis TaxID=2486004 RepID=UPI000F7A52CD|nr:metalloregulator ArsR/SmtB family transcription factor [Companilactobacillus kedongensis]
MDYENFSKQLKAISDPNRLKIIDLLSCGTLCACDLLEHFEFTQPTLSHHMKILQEAGIVSAKRVGKWQHYTLESSFIAGFNNNVSTLFENGPECACHCKK